MEQTSRKTRRSPYGWAAARVERGTPVGRVLAPLLGPKLTGWLLKRTTRGLLREKPGGGLGLRRKPRDANGTQGRLFARIAIIHLDETIASRGTACSPALVQARVAARVGLSRRQLQRYSRILQASEVLAAHQPPVAAMPPRLRGRDYAYNVYRWGATLPRATQTHLARWGAGMPATWRRQAIQAIPERDIPF